MCLLTWQPKAPGLQRHRDTTSAGFGYLMWRFCLFLLKIFTPLTKDFITQTSAPPHQFYSNMSALSFIYFCLFCVSDMRHLVHVISFLFLLGCIFAMKGVIQIKFGLRITIIKNSFKGSEGTSTYLVHSLHVRQVICQQRQRYVK